MAQLSVREIPARIRQRDLSVHELLQATIERIERTDPFLQAWVELTVRVRFVRPSGSIISLNVEPCFRSMAYQSVSRT